MDPWPSSQTIQTGERVINQQTGKKKHSTQTLLSAAAHFLQLLWYLGRLHPLEHFRWKCLLNGPHLYSVKILPPPTFPATHKLSRCWYESNCECKIWSPQTIKCKYLPDDNNYIYNQQETSGNWWLATHCLECVSLSTESTEGCLLVLILTVLHPSNKCWKI